MLNILYVQYGKDWISGQERALLSFITALDKNSFKPVVWSNAGAVHQECQQMQITSIRSQMEYYGDYCTPPFKLRQFVKQIWTAYKLIKQHDIDIVHCNGAAPSQWLTPLCRLLGVKVVVHLHTTYLRRSRYITFLHFSNALIGCSKKVLENVWCDQIRPPAIVKHLYNGISQALIDESLDFMANPSKIGSINFIFVGSLQRHKGLDVALRALSQASNDLPDWRLTVAGDGDHQSEFVQLTDALKLNSRVFFCGRLSKVAPLYKESDILLIPSRQEGFALVAIEAALFAIPAVACRTGGIPEAVIDGETGLLVESEDVSAFAVALTTLARDPQLRKDLGSAAQARARTNFSISTRVAELQQLYASL